ncbi:hypothetical protein C8T65DRAFT_707526 [Cerioporus squamosus]|nr:hypothetical protein C8T65DRAFT_707526 [Cerioporus squamosus]
MNHSWDVYARELMSLGFGHPLWRPEPCLQFGEIRLGDVGYLREGRFRFLFKCMRIAEDPVNARRGVPSGFEVFSPPDPMLTQDHNEITQTELHSKSLQSLSLTATASTGSTSVSPSLGLRYPCGEESGALLMLKHPGHKTSLDCGMYIRRYMRTHLASWCDFANGHLGCTSRTSSSSPDLSRPFHNSCSSGELLVAGGCFVPSVSGAFRVSMSKSTNASVSSRTGPQARLSALQSGSHAADDFDLFNTTKPSVESGGYIPAVMRAAAGPHVIEHGQDDDDERVYPLSSALSSTSSSDEDIDTFHPVSSYNILK